MSVDKIHLAEIYERLRALEAQVQALTERLGGGPPVPPFDQPVDAVEEALRAGRYMEAVTRYQHATGASLSEAKAAVDAKQKALRPG